VVRGGRNPLVVSHDSDEVPKSIENSQPLSVKSECPGVISCADILTLSDKNGIVLMGSF
jgi:hypothetical protein